MTDKPLYYTLSERWANVPTFSLHEGSVQGNTRQMNIDEGYPWDGASGPTIDTKDSMLPSLIHDFLYEAFRQGKLDPGEWREKADLEFYDLCLACGMGKLRASTWYYAIRWGAAKAARPESNHQVLEAP